MKPARHVEPGQVWEFPGDDLTPNYGICLVLRKDVSPELDAEQLKAGPHLCLMLLDEGDNWGEGNVITLWLSGSNWDLLEA